MSEKIVVIPDKVATKTGLWQTVVWRVKRLAMLIAACLASKKFVLGSSEIITVLDAQREQLNVSAQLAQSDIQVLRNLIAVYKSLGGWKT